MLELFLGMPVYLYEEANLYLASHLNKLLKGKTIYGIYILFFIILLAHLQESAIIVAVAPRIDNIYGFAPMATLI